MLVLQVFGGHETAQNTSKKMLTRSIGWNSSVVKNPKTAMFHSCRTLLMPKLLLQSPRQVATLPIIKVCLGGVVDKSILHLLVMERRQAN